MRLLIAALADYANIAQGDKLNLSGVFDTIWVKKFPSIHPTMVLALRFQLEYEDGEKDHSLDVFIEDPDGHEFAKTQTQLTAPKIKPGQVLVSNQILTFRGLGLKEPGKVIFRIVWDGDEKQRVFLYVVQMPQQHGEQA